MAQRLRIAILLGLLTQACAASDGDEPATRAQCEAVQKHRASLRMREVRKKTKLPKADLAKHEEGFARVTEAFLDACVEEHHSAWARCMLKLESLNEAGTCE